MSATTVEAHVEVDVVDLRAAETAVVETAVAVTAAAAASVGGAPTAPADTEPAGDTAVDSDAEIVLRARAGDGNAVDELIRRYHGRVRNKAASYFLIGGDRDDLVQEGMIGLFKAIRDFDPDHEVSFAGFADLCVTRQLISAIKAASRLKHGPLNASVSLSARGGDGGALELADLLPATARCGDPCDLVINAESLRGLADHVQAALSALEVEVLRLHLDGKSYAEMAVLLDRHVKSVDNALQRVKRKIDEHLRTQQVIDLR